MTDRKPPWEKPNPHKGAPKHLTEKQKDAAKERAEEAGRRYPNIVDNMWALKQKK